jgi:DNA-binding NtrC family response regulator
MHFIHDLNHNNNNNNNNKITILAVDDEFDIVRIIKLSLKRYGFDVFAFTDPYMALEHFKINSKDYDLVISDIRMPGMNGFEFARRIKEINPTMKILFMSAFDINDIELPTDLGSTNIHGFIQKPISARELNIIIQKKVYQPR